MLLLFTCELYYIVKSTCWANASPFTSAFYFLWISHNTKFISKTKNYKKNFVLSLKKPMPNPTTLPCEHYLFKIKRNNYCSERASGWTGLICCSELSGWTDKTGGSTNGTTAQEGKRVRLLFDSSFSVTYWSPRTRFTPVTLFLDLCTSSSNFL